VRQPDLSPYAIEVQAFVRLVSRIVIVHGSKLGLGEALPRLKCRWGDALFTH
jgi:hypothetical protein